METVIEYAVGIFILVSVVGFFVSVFSGVSGDYGDGHGGDDF